MKQIYQDATRTISKDEYALVIANAQGAKEIPLSSEISDALPIDAEQALRSRGYDPQGWYALIVPRRGGYGGALLALLPPETRAPVAATLAAYQAEIAAERDKPCNVERRRIAALYAQAEAKQDEPGEYFPLRAQAEAAQKAWQEEYPEAAMEEAAEELEAAADELAGKAQDALVYDADGSLDAQDRERRASEYRAQAEIARAKARELRAQAETLRGGAR